MNSLTWEIEETADEEGYDYYYTTCLGDYAAYVYACRLACIKYTGIPAELGMTIDLDDSLYEETKGYTVDDLMIWAEEKLQYRNEHGHTSADISMTFGPSYRIREEAPQPPWVCSRDHIFNWLPCVICKAQYDAYVMLSDEEKAGKDVVSE